ncbi:MAG: hypothetical protein HKM94_00590, partial [Halobacteria archaeon]|nr:hypothetical protein [Halobacteria archaeon]
MNIATAQPKRFANKFATWACAILYGLGLGQVSAADVDISDIPLDVLEGVPANIILTMDDSGSMAWGFLPDSINNRSSWQNAKSSIYNKIYYDPTVTYTPAVDKNGASLGHSTFINAWDDGFNQGGSKTNLSSDFEVVWANYVVYNPDIIPGTGAAYYYKFDTTQTTGGAACDPTNSTHVNTQDDCYTKVDVSSTSGVNRYDPDLTAC